MSDWKFWNVGFQRVCEGESHILIQAIQHSNGLPGPLTTLIPMEEHGPFAILPDGSEYPPDSLMGGYYGTSLLTPEAVEEAGGLEARGSNMSLLAHVEQHTKDSAFRGTTEVLSTPDGTAGAVLWAGEGGFVFEIRGVPTWNVNRALEGRVPGPLGFQDNPMGGELENVVVARVPWNKIRRTGQVSATRTGRLVIREWKENPHFLEDGQ